MKTRLAALLLIVLLAASAAWARKAPDFMLKDLDGNPVFLSKYQGRYVLLEILLTTCPHCQASARVLQKLSSEYPANLQVIGINMNLTLPPDAATAAIKEFKQSLGVTFPVLQGDLLVGVNYVGISATHPNFHVPVFFLISPTGEILEDHNSERPQDKDFYANTDANLEAMVRRLVPADKPGAKPVAKRVPAKKSEKQ